MFCKKEFVPIIATTDVSKFIPKPEENAQVFARIAPITEMFSMPNYRSTDKLKMAF